MSTPLIDRAAVAERLGIAPRTVGDLVARRKLGAVRVGRLLRFEPDEVDAYIARQRQRASAPDLPPLPPPITLEPLPKVQRRRFV